MVPASRPDTSAADGRSQGVVVGVDGSASAAAALAWAAAEAAARASRLDVVTTWIAPVALLAVPAMTTDIDTTVYVEEAEAIAAKAVDFVASTYGDRLPVAARAVEGWPADELVAASAAHGLLVVGDRGRGGFTSLLLGSVAMKCTQSSRVPVVVVREPVSGWPAGSVVVGVDGSDGSACALRWAASEAALHGRRLRVVHGWDTAFAVPPGGMAVAPLDDRSFVEESRRTVARFVDESLAGTTMTAPIDIVPIPALAPRALIEQSSDAALLVVGSRGRGSLAGLVLGSVSQQCLHHAACPVAIVPS